MTFYEKLAATSRKLIAQYGRTVTLQRLDGTPGNADFPWEGPATPTVAFAQAVPGVFVPASGAGLGEDWLNSELLASVSEVLLIGPDPVNDYTNINQVVDQSLTFAVSWVKVLRPADEILLYAMGISR